MRGLSRTAAIIRTGSALGAVIAVVGGGVALFTTANSAGSLFLIGLGILLGLFAALGPRLEIESFEVLGAKVKVREVIKSRIALAQAAEGGADDARAEAMRAQALAVRLSHKPRFAGVCRPGRRGRFRGRPCSRPEVSGGSELPSL